MLAVGLHTCTAVARSLCVSWAFLLFLSERLLRLWCSGTGNTPHVYLTSGPSGRGGYWAIDEHSRYVWYHYVAPDQFIKDETTAIDVDQARRSHYLHSTLNDTDSASRMTGELRRRPGRVRCGAKTTRTRLFTRVLGKVR